MSDGIHKGHRARMRKRFLEEGTSSFADHELLEMYLYGAIPMKDTNKLAHILLNEFGSLTEVLEADAEDLMSRCGLCEAAAVQLALQKEFRRRTASAKLGEKPVIDSVQKAGELAMSLLSGRNYERNYLICLDAKSRVRKIVCLGEGTVTEAAFYPRTIVEQALKYQATGVILAHNHPGGACRPSFSDVQNTEQIRKVLRMIGIALFDHIIVSDETFFSFAERKMLSQPQEEES